jgi:hypothetical protein
MKSISAGLEAAFGSDLMDRAVCLKMTRTDAVVVAATNHDRDLISGGVDYLASAGGSETDVQTSAALNVDSVSQSGILNLDSITNDDLHSGLYDDAAISLFVVNYSNLSQGIYHLRDGHIGQVSTERDFFTAELRGVTEAVQKTLTGLCNPLCPYNLGDFPFPAPGRGRCTKDLSGGTAGSPSIPYTVTGTLTGVSADQQTLFDTARTEPGPSGGIAVTGITNANPGVVTTATALGLPDQSTVVIAGVVGPALLNAVTVIHNSSGTTFELGVDTSDTSAYPPYISGGTVTPLGGDSGWFDYGLCTITSGPNANRSMEVKAYAPGQWTLQLPFYYPLLGNETYSMVAGCNKSATTCKAKFDNLDNHGGYPFVPGQDKIIQVATPQSGQTANKKV